MTATQESVKVRATLTCKDRKDLVEKFKEIVERGLSVINDEDRPLEKSDNGIVYPVILEYETSYYSALADFSGLTTNGLVVSPKE